MSTNTQKLRVIRSRTDHDLLILVERELDRGLILVDLATTRNSPAFVRARKSLETAGAVIPRISTWEEAARIRIQAAEKELRSRLDRVPQYANLRSYPASFAS